MVRRNGPTPTSFVVEDPGDDRFVRSGEVFGRGYERGWSVYVSDGVHKALGLQRDSWDVLVPEAGCFKDQQG